MVSNKYLDDLEMITLFLFFIFFNNSRSEIWKLCSSKFVTFLFLVHSSWGCVGQMSLLPYRASCCFGHKRSICV